MQGAQSQASAQNNPGVGARDPADAHWNNDDMHSNINSQITAHTYAMGSKPQYQNGINNK